MIPLKTTHELLHFALALLSQTHKMLAFAKTRYIEKNVSLQLLCDDYVSIIADVSIPFMTETQQLTILAY